VRSKVSFIRGRFWALAFAAAFVFAFAGCGGTIGGGGGDGETIEMDLATVYEADAPQSMGAERFAELVGEKSGGQIVVNFFPGGSLGTEQDNFNAVSSGELDMVLGGSTGIDMFANEFMFFQTPYMMQDIDHVNNFIESDLHQDLVDAMGESNIHLLGHIIRGARNSTSNQPFTTPEELRGISLRLPESPTWIAVWEGLGASATPVALPELYSALQTGVVDASEGPYEQFATFSLQEVQDYVINTEHIYEVTEIWIDKELYDSLSDEQRQWIDEAAAEAVEYANEEAARMEQEFLQELTDGGMEVIDPDRDAFLEAAQEPLQRLFETQFTVTTYDEVMELAE
jgi:tripartite ATP-independent transporter DctP family solute receptor